MKRDAENTPTRSRPRKKAAAMPAPVAALEPETVTTGETAVATPEGDDKNVGPVESGLSVVVGLLFLIAALFPRSIKQLLLLGIGGGLVFRGVKSQCSVYAALGIDTVKEPLLKQVSEKFL